MDTDEHGLRLKVESNDPL